MNAALAATVLSPHARARGLSVGYRTCLALTQRQTITDVGAAWLIPDPASARPGSRCAGECVAVPSSRPQCLRAG